MPRKNKVFKKPQKYLGPSQFATVLGLNPYETKDELKERLENGCWQEVRRQAEFGIQHERRGIDHYSSETGWSVINPKWQTLPTNKRIGGIADGLVCDPKTGELLHGLEVKCHPDKTEPIHELPTHYLVQIVGYMALYRLDDWDLISVCFNQSVDGEVYDHKIHRVRWLDMVDTWENDWLPKLEKFVADVDWKY